MKFTTRSIAALKPKSERFEVWDNGRAGFGLRMRPRRMTLGTHPAVSLASAHVKHAVAKEALEKSTDPGTLHVEKRRAERQAVVLAGANYRAAKANSTLC